MTTETAIRERPILFSGEMVRAILDGRKTQTRRVLSKQPLEIIPMKTPGLWTGLMSRDPNRGVVFKCKYGRPGDRLWVREAARVTALCGNAAVVQYKADLSTINALRIPRSHAGLPTAQERENFYSGRFMPRWASRISLEITDVRVERVQEISVNDSRAEGSPWDEHGFRSEHRPWFIETWNSINAKRGFGWDVNPWVWVIEFKRLDS